MKVKHFHIRLNKENLHQDEEALNSFMQSVSVKKTATQLISAGQANYWSILVFFMDLQPLEEIHENTSEKQPTFDPINLNTEERTRYNALRTWRADTASKENFPQYIIAHNSQLGAIAKLNPTITDDLFGIKGLGERKIAKYGDEIIAVLNSV
jgi:superfamily II DNA helicase RecQ